MNFVKAVASVLVSFAVLQIIEGYSKEAEDALKALARYELLQRSKTATVTGTDKRDSILAVLDAASGAAGFWSNSVLQLTYAANRVSAYLVPEMKTNLTELGSALSGIEAQGSIAIRDGKIAFNDAAKPIATAVQIVAALKGALVEFFIDGVKEMLQNATQVVANAVKDLTANNSQIFVNVKSQLDKMTKHLDEFTAIILRSRCYPDVLCVEKSFRSVKDLVAEALDAVEKGEDSAAKIVLLVDSVTNLKIREEEGKIKRFAIRLLESYNITMANIAEYYVVLYNPTMKLVQVQMKRASDYLNTLLYYDLYYRNTLKNTAYASIYPVIDATNTVAILKRKYNGKALGSEVAEVYVMLDKIHAEVVDMTPNYTSQIEAFSVQVEQMNSSAIASVIKYLEKYINASVVDLVDFFTVYVRIVDIEAPQVLDEAKIKVDALLKQAQQLLPVIRSTFENSKAALDAKLQKLLQDVVFGIANRLYENANITIADIFLYGSSNLNNTYKYWVPLIDAEIKDIDKIYTAIVEKNYGGLSIQVELVNITKGVLDVLKSYEDVFGADLVKARSIDVVAELTTVPAAEYTDFIKYNQNNMKELFDSKDKYVKQVQLLDDDRLQFLKEGPLMLENSTIPHVQQSHYNNNRTYQAKLKLNAVLTALKNIKSGLTASETGIRGAASIVTGRIKHTANEYVALMHKTAKLKVQQPDANLPSITVVVKEIKGSLWIAN